MPASGLLRVATFNINNIRKRLPNLLEWLASSKPDVVCLQELKTAHRDFPLGPMPAPPIGWTLIRHFSGVMVVRRPGRPHVNALYRTNGTDASFCRTTSRDPGNRSPERA
ncbi:MAG TPA: endonuclease/exonuclease/phosphatase family protein [Sphingomicrobium sp.]|nr:endonuclease/exonuclease/phosphatase family protein [Sphingomicrobium sp.]